MNSEMNDFDAEQCVGEYDYDTRLLKQHGWVKVQLFTTPSLDEGDDCPTDDGDAQDGTKDPHPPGV